LNGAKTETVRVEKDEETNTKLLVEKFLNGLSQLILLKLREDSVLTLHEAYLYAVSMVEPLKGVSSKVYGVFLLNQLRRLRDVILDKAAEAISAHVDHIDSDVVYAELSASIMRYAIHELNLIQTLIDTLEHELKDEEENVDTELLEEFIFAAVARFLAIMRLVSNLRTERLGKYLRSLTKTLDVFISEELSILRERILEKNP